MSTRPIRELWAERGQQLLLYGALFGGLIGVLLTRLNTLTGGNYSASEAGYFAQSQHLHGLLHNPVNAPFLILLHGLQLLDGHQGFVLGRLVSAGVGGLVLVAFCLLLRAWYGSKTALLGTALFGSSSWFLHTARLGTPDVLMFALFLLVATGAWLKHTGNPIALICCMMLCGSLLYVPGMIWLLALGVLWQWRTIDRLFNQRLWAVTLGGVLWLGMLVPLGWALFKTPHLAFALAGIPDHMPSIWPTIHHILEVPVRIFVRGVADPEHWTGRLPVLDIFSLVLFVQGIAVGWRNLRLGRVPLFVSIAVAGSVLIGLQSGVSLSVLVPFIYIAVAAGAGQLLETWLRVFPFNPIARAVGISMMLLVLGMSCAYHLREYFVAWPQAAVTQQAFTVSTQNLVPRSTNLIQ